MEVSVVPLGLLVRKLELAALVHQRRISTVIRQIDLQLFWVIVTQFVMHVRNRHAIGDTDGASLERNAACNPAHWQLI